MGLDEILDNLVIRYRFGRRRFKFTRRSGPLVFQLEADDPKIQTWLETFYDQYAGVLPINKPVAAKEATARNVAEELLEIAKGCGSNGRPAFRLPITFPRFAAAYAVLQPKGPETVDELEKTVKKAIKDARKDVLPDLRKEVGEIAKDPFWEKILGGLLALAFRVIGSLRFPYFMTIRWFRKKGFEDRELRTTRLGLQELSNWRERPDEKHLLLVHALLADINAHYGFLRRLNRARQPVILLPEVDKVPPRRLIRDVFLATCDGRARDLRTYPVVIATATADDAPVAVSEAGTAVRRWFERGHTGPDQPSRLLRISLRGNVSRPGANRRMRFVGPVTAAMLALAVAAAVTGAAVPIQRWAASCGERLEWAGQDCVGPSDGNDVFMPQLEGMKEVFSRIAAENARVDTVKHATLAVMIPMESDVPAVREQILGEVRGAFLAQHEANRPEGATPPIRLVLVNPGRNYEQWQHALDLLLKREPDLRVVTDFNLSLNTTRAVMSELTKNRGIPVVAGLVTSEKFANPESTNPRDYPFPGLARVVSTTKEQAAALLRSDTRLSGSETALVADTRPNDDYNDSLRRAFTEVRRSNKKGVGVQDMTFASKGLEVVGNTPNMFEAFAHNLCESNAHYVYFAGRAFHLKIFIQQLATVYCKDKPSYTVVTGSDATTIASRLSDADRALLRGDPGIGRPSVSVEYAAPAHPAAWTAGEKGDLPAYLAEPRHAMTELQQNITDTGLGRVSLEDGRTVIAHDAVLTAAKELARAAAINNTELPSTAQVRESMPNLNAAYRVLGASGWICLTGAGNPYNKPVPVVRLDGASGKLRLKAVAWPEGGPPKNNCVVPQLEP